MKTESAVFNNGTYDRPCELFTDIKIGSTSCVGHSKLPKAKKCKYCVSHKEENTYFLPILKETIPIVSEVVCNRPSAQLSFF